MTTALFDTLKRLDVEYAENFEISKISYIGIGGTTRVIATPDSFEKLTDLVDYLVDSGIKYKVVGAMSNILPSDDNYFGVLISTNKLRNYFVAEKAINLQCGARLSAVINKISDISKGGMHELYGIPGSVGGMIYGNAGAYGKDISDFLINATVYSPRKRRTVTLLRSELGFSYRTSNLKGDELILLSAELRINDLDSDLIKMSLGEITNRRKASQPYGERSLGSIFKRFGDTPISKMIDELGLKGYRIGGAEISKKHAGFIVNSSNATSKDVKELIDFIKNKIRNAYGIEAEEEIEYLE